MTKVTLKLNTDIPHAGKVHVKDSQVTVEVDDDGVVIDRFWRNRVRDAALDNCVEVVDNNSGKKDKSK